MCVLIAQGFTCLKSDNWCGCLTHHFHHYSSFQWSDSMRYLNKSSVSKLWTMEYVYTFVSTMIYDSPKSWQLKTSLHRQRRSFSRTIYFVNVFGFDTTIRWYVIVEFNASQSDWWDNGIIVRLTDVETCTIALLDVWLQELCNYTIVAFHLPAYCSINNTTTPYWLSKEINLWVRLFYFRQKFTTESFSHTLYTYLIQIITKEIQ